MVLNRWSQRFYESTRGRIVALLRRASLTVDQIARSLGLTGNAVRAHLATLERDGIVQQGVSHSGGVGKPAYTYRIAEDAEPLFSSAYVPILQQLLAVLSQQLPPEQLDSVLRAVGHRLAANEIPGTGTTRARAERAARMLNDIGGVAEVVDDDGALHIRGLSCPLGAAVHEHPEVCVAVETLLSDIVGAPLHECCDRADRPRCCFDVLTDASH
ncbi:MAG: helix-turn-helix transcriptional regulator [Gemmatimonadaceae bacterium]